MKRFGREVWIGLAGVRPRPGNEIFGRRAGAYVNVVALADTLDDPRRVVTSHFDQLRFDVTEIEDLEPLEQRLDRHGVSEEILDLVTELSRATVVVNHVFHTYETEAE
jgi:hypothetical protein